MKNSRRGRKCQTAFLCISLITLIAGCNSNYFSPVPSSGINSASGDGMSGSQAEGGVTPGDITGSGDPTSFNQTNCQIGYPFSSSVVATDVAFNESDVLAAFSPQFQISSGYTINVWYTDEHAMTLGIREIQVVTSSGTAITDYAVSPLATSPGAQPNPSVGAIALSGDQAGVDTSTCTGSPDSCSRPMYPAAFVTDTTTNSTSMSGDWQYGGPAFVPDGVYGTWKAAVRVIDKTQSPPRVSVTPDNDPAQKNQWNLGSGVPAPAGIPTEGYTAVVSWNSSHLGLISGHSYRIQFMVHDGDQNQSGGDVGENCVNLTMR